MKWRMVTWPGLPGPRLQIPGTAGGGGAASSRAPRAPGRRCRKRWAGTPVRAETAREPDSRAEAQRRGARVIVMKRLPALWVRLLEQDYLLATWG